MYTNGGWITTKEAAAYLGITRNGVRQLYLRGKLHRSFPEEGKRFKTAYYLWEEVMEMRATTARVKRRFCIHLLPEHWQCDEWITVKKAAEILGVSPPSVSRLVRRRFFVFRYMKEFGIKRRILLSRRQVEKYRDDADRQKNSALHKQDWVYEPPAPLSAEEEAKFEQKKWLTIPEAARCLGVSRTAIYEYCRVVRLPRYPVGVSYGFKQQWWIDYEEVRRLREDPEYQKRRARFRACVTGLPHPPPPLLSIPSQARRRGGVSYRSRAESDAALKYRSGIAKPMIRRG